MEHNGMRRRGNSNRGGSHDVSEGQGLSPEDLAVLRAAQERSVAAARAELQGSDSVSSSNGGEASEVENVLPGVESDNQPEKKGDVVTDEHGPENSIVRRDTPHSESEEQQPSENAVKISHVESRSQQQSDAASAKEEKQPDGNTEKSAEEPTEEEIAQAIAEAQRLVGEHSMGANKGQEGEGQSDDQNQSAERQQSGTSSEEKPPTPEKKSASSTASEKAEMKKIEIEKLRDEVEQARKEYVEKDFKVSNMFARLKSLFRSIDDTQPNEDVKEYKRRYLSKLSSLQKAQFDEINQSRLSGKDFDEAMKGMMRGFRVDEALELMKERDTCRLEDKSWSGKIANGFRKVGEWYNSQSTSAKIVVGIGTALLAGAVGGPLAAGGVAACRKFLASAGLSVAFDAKADEEMMRKFREQAEHELEKDLEKLYGTNPQELENTQSKEEQAFINEARFHRIGGAIVDIDSSYKDLIKQRGWNAVKGGLKGFGVVFGGGYLVQAAMEHGGSEAINHVKDAFAITGSAPANPVPEVDPFAMRETVAGLHAPITPDISADLLKDYALTSADGPRGLWGVLESHLPKDMPQADKTKAVAALEKIISQKLDAMSPEELQATGFRSPDINYVYAGDTLHFDHVLTSSDVHSAIGSTPYGADFEQPGYENDDFGVSHPEPAADQLSETAETFPTSADTVVDGTQEVSPEGVELSSDGTGTVDGIASGAEQGVVEASYISDPKLFLSEHPDQFPNFKHALANFRIHIFQTPEISSLPDADYDYVSHKQLGYADADRIVSGFRSGVESSNFPLHESQMQSLDRFASAAQRYFGSDGIAKPHESIDAYTSRIAAFVTQRQMEEPRFKFRF